jgi:hypothetical protein
MQQIVQKLSIAGAAFMVTGVAFAGFDGRVVPGPIAGAGLPLIAAAGGALWLVRKFSDRRRQD